jgi:hypothetical protein
VESSTDEDEPPTALLERCLLFFVQTRLAAFGWHRLGAYFVRRHALFFVQLCGGAWRDA